MAKILISLALLILIYSCENNTKSNTESAKSNLQDTNQYLYFKDSLDVDTAYARGIDQPDSVRLFFRNAHDTLWSYVLRSYIDSKKKEVFSLDSLNSILYKAEFEISPCDSFLCGFKKEFNKRYRFRLEIDKEVELITTFEFWFEGKRYLSPMENHTK